MTKKKSMSQKNVCCDSISMEVEIQLLNHRVNGRNVKINKTPQCYLLHWKMKGDETMEDLGGA